MNIKYTLAALSTGFLVAGSTPAFAQSGADGECVTDADCPDEFVCEEIGWGACPSCEPGTECPPCETGTSTICVPPPPKECDADNACDGDDVCVTYTFETCSGWAAPACDPDDSTCVEPTEPPPEPECDTATESYCVPPYLAPCTADADCGAGFTCEALEVCQCSGGGSTGAPGADPAPEPDCGCDATGENYCELIEVECTTDADCAAGLTCQEAYGGAIAVTCIDGEPCPEPDPVAPVSYCAPPDYGYYGGAPGGGGYGETVANATGHADADVAKSEREDFFPVDGGSGGSSKESPSSCSTIGEGGGGSIFLLLAGLFFGRRRS